MDHYAKAYPIFSRIRGLEEVKKVIKSLKRFSKDEVARERLRIIEFYDLHGEKTIREAFKVDRDTVWIWKKRLKESHNSISSLIPTPTTPKTRRTMITNPKVVLYINPCGKSTQDLEKKRLSLFWINTALKKDFRQ